MRYCNDENFFTETILFDAKRIYDSDDDKTLTFRDIFDKLANLNAGFDKMYNENDKNTDEMKVILWYEYDFTLFYLNNFTIGNFKKSNWCKSVL